MDSDDPSSKEKELDFDLPPTNVQENTSVVKDQLNYQDKYMVDKNKCVFWMTIILFHK